MRKRDFTLVVYEAQIKSILASGYKILPFKEYLSKPEEESIVILRHDVDKKPGNALRTAQIAKTLGIVSTYYFRIVKSSFNEKIIKQIANLGHEIGYHYEDLTLANGNIEKARELFITHLSIMRKLYPVSTICMHGSPLSKWDNRNLWDGFNYKEFGIIGEPYLDLDYNRFLYFTDTGRRWNGEKYSIRDKVDSNNEYNYKSTYDLIEAFNSKKIANKNIVLTIHPQRWSDDFIPWTIELILQNIKNNIKKYFTH